MAMCGCSGYFVTHQLELAAKEREKLREAKKRVK